MHKNYRRKQGKRSKRGSKKGWPRPYSLTESRRFYWQEVRTQTRDLLQLGRYEDLTVKHKNSILWDWW